MASDREALRKLANEVTAVIAMAEPELRHVCGQTNFALLVQRRDEAYAALAAPPSAQDGWQPIETAPKDGTRVLVRSGNLVPTVSRCDMSGKWIAQFDVAWSSPLSQPSHWMPLPPPPAGAS